jgi:lipoprotein-anchoring transpeptidase ErfK/SrfK
MAEDDMMFYIPFRQLERVATGIRRERQHYQPSVSRVCTIFWSGLVSAGAVAFGLAPAHAGDVVAFGHGVPAGTIVIKTSERRLYYVLDDSRAIRYAVGVGKDGKQWTGQTFVNGKYLNPAWSPPAEIRHDKPQLPNIIAGGSTQNPMGAAAMTLNGGEYAIHGTNRPGSIGGFVSYGCIRMYNRDVIDLYGRVSVGTPVVVQ